MDLSNNYQDGGQLSSQPGDPIVSYTLNFQPYSLSDEAKDLSMSQQMIRYRAYATNILQLPRPNDINGVIDINTRDINANIRRYYAFKKMSNEVINRPLGIVFKKGDIIQTKALNQN